MSHLVYKAQVEALSTEFNVILMSPVFNHAAAHPWNGTITSREISRERSMT